MLRILDTDHVSLLERKNTLVTDNFSRFLDGEIAITLITWEEQIRGRFHLIRQANSSEQRISAYARLLVNIDFLKKFPIINFDEIADRYYLDLVRQKIRIGTQDLKIASIALASSAILVTRNQQDFAKVPNLILEDWTIT